MEAGASLGFYRCISIFGGNGIRITFGDIFNTDSILFVQLFRLKDIAQWLWLIINDIRNNILTAELLYLVGNSPFENGKSK